MSNDLSTQRTTRRVVDHPVRPDTTLFRLLEVVADAVVKQLAIRTAIDDVERVTKPVDLSDADSTYGNPPE